MPHSTKYAKLNISYSEKAESIYQHLKVNENPEVHKEIISFITGGATKNLYLDAISVDAYEKGIDFSVKSENLGKLKGFVRDHCVPLKLIVEYLLEHKETITVDEIKDVLKACTAYCVISEEDDNKLTKNELKEQLSKGYTIEDIIKDPTKRFCRYETAGIKYKVNPNN